jgi:aspartyl aminopeptidase
MAYLDKSPDPFHATQNACDRLAAAGFMAIDEKDAWAGKLAKGGRYYFTRNRSCIVAFAVGGAYEPGNGFKVIGAHTDSPNLRVKPRSKRSNAGITQLSVECYGGGLWHTWFDRDLSLSGRVMLRAASGGFEQRLVRIPRPVLRVPTLCIHLQSTEEREAFKVNKEDHLPPFLIASLIASLIACWLPPSSGEQGRSPATNIGDRGTQEPFGRCERGERKCPSGRLRGSEREAAWRGGRCDWRCGGRCGER